MFFTLFKLALNTLRGNKSRTLLTTLGVIVGTATVIIVISLGEGVKALILGQLGSLTPDTIAVQTQIPSRSKLPQQRNAITTGTTITTMKIKDVEDVQKLPTISLAFARALSQEKLVYKNVTKTSYVIASQWTYPQVQKANVIQGRFFTNDEDNALARVVVLGYDMKKILFGDDNALGKSIKIKGISFQVIGVFDKLGSQGFFNVDEIVYIPLQTGQKLLLGINYIPLFVVQVKDISYLPSTITQIQQILRRNHNIKDPSKDDFQITTGEDALSIVNTVTTGISILLLSIAAISLIVGGIGIMNIMYVTVTERIREIGLRKAIGARPASILLQFLLEAVLVTLLGGFLGIAIGIGISWGVAQIAHAFSFNWPFVIPLNAVLVAFSVSTAFGIIFGYAPARRASKLNPIEALRYE